MYDKELQKEVNSFLKDLEELKEDGYEEECYILLGCASKEFADAPADVALVSRGDITNTTPSHFCSLIAETIIHICGPDVRLIGDILQGLAEECARAVKEELKKKTEDKMNCKFGN